MADVQAYEPGPPQPDAPEVEEKSDSHMDAPLDDEDEYRRQQTRQPVFVDATVREHEVRPIIPANLRSWENIRKTVGYWTSLTARRTAVHAVRVPFLYLPKALFWAPIGAFRLIGRQLVTAGIRQSWHLQQVAADRKDSEEWRKLRDDFWSDVKWRAIVVGAELFVAVVAAVLLWTAAPRWALALAVATALPWLAHVGRPRTAPIVTPAVVTTRFRRINPDVVLRAYYAAGLGSPDKKKDMEVVFPGRMTRDAKETGSMVPVDLPYGKTFADAVNAREKIASGLDVSVQQVFLTRLDRERRHQLFVTDQDPLALPVGHTDMLDGKMRSIWQPIPLGRDERDRLVTLSLLWKALLIAAQPRRGKTFFVRLILLYAALDPWVKILGADGKKSTDYDKLRLVAHRWVIGDAPNPRDNDPLSHLEEMLDEVLAHIAKVNDVLAALPVELCPEGVLTEELSRDPRYPDLRIWVLTGEEFQVYFETEDQDYNKRIAHKWGRIMAQGPSAGVILLDSTQKPSGVGAGDVSRLFNRFRDNHGTRFALRCGNRDVSQAALGGDAYSEGYDASALPIGDGQNGTKDYRGIGILYGASDVTPTVRTFLADHVDAEKILIAARAHRERLGLLSGLAAGEEVTREYRDVMADARSVFFAGEARISWPELANRMREVMPQYYADLTPEAISAQLRTLGVVGKNVRDAKHFEKGVGQGFELASLDAAIKRRELTGAA